MIPVPKPVGALLAAPSYPSHVHQNAIERSGRGEDRGRGKQRSYIGFLLLAVPLTAHAAPVRVTPADAPGIKRAIAAQKGHVVLVNLWATWCGPCVAEFPALVQTSRRYKASGLRVFAVSADQLKDAHTKVAPFLAKSGADFPAYLERSTDPEEFINAFDPAWQGDLPRTIIYDRTGKRVKTLSGEQTAQSFAAAVQPYLQSRSGSPSRPARRYARK